MEGIEGAEEEEEEAKGKNPYKEASQKCEVPNPYTALKIAAEVQEPPKKSQRSGSEPSQRGDRPRQDHVVKNEEAAVRLWQMRQGFEDHPLHSMAIHTPVPTEKPSSESEEEDESEDDSEDVGKKIEAEEEVCEGGQELFKGCKTNMQSCVQG